VVASRRPVRRLPAAVAGVLTGAAITPTPVSAARAGAAACSQDVTFEADRGLGSLHQISSEGWQATDAVDLNGVPITPVR
jgi:hypothetical protein